MENELDVKVLEIDEKLPLLPLRDVVLFPHITVPLLVGRVASVNAIEEAVAGKRILFATAQKRPDVVDPQKEDLYRLGTVVRVLQLFRLPDGTMRVLVEGLHRARVRRFLSADDYVLARVEMLGEEPAQGPEIEALMRSVAAAFNEYVHLNRRISDEVLLTVNNLNDPAAFAHSVASHLQVKVSAKQEILELDSVRERLAHLSQVLHSELEIVKLERKIEGQVRSQVHKNQKEFYLNEQLKAIRKELGYQNEFAGEIEELERQIKKAKMPKEVREKAEKELDRLSKMSFMSPEATVLRTYLDWLVSVPWKKRTPDNLDLVAVKKTMDEDHYGLKKIKERILEYLAVVKLSGQIKGPILCLVGPPGVGKTSLGASIARSMNRKFVRMSLGGVRDEAEIRGHRRTYIGSMPGRIIQAMKRAGVVNPLILLDEVDKLGADWRGDPASALLEVLDPEQNTTFNDHYLEVDYDLSQVLFITTANHMSNIPPALLDRMELLQLPGYLLTEKISIAKQFLLSKQKKRNGLAADDLEMSDGTFRAIVQGYTREAGVRNLERGIGSVIRKVARRKAEGETKFPIRVTPASLTGYLGPPRFLESPLERRFRVGVANGLAWTEAGGDLMTIEVTIVPGKGTLNLTGKLGDVMRESGVAALTYARKNAEEWGLDKWFYQDQDIHIHVPEGAIPKDGPSAGITMAVALVSALTGVPTKPEVAMTGEITLRGTVLPIGGLTEKVVAAKQAGAKTIIIPKANAKDLTEIPAPVKKGLTFIQVEHMDEVLRYALDRLPMGRSGQPEPLKPPESPEPPAEAPPEAFTHH
jgi:ATP-dependent Lon protease